MQAVYKTYPSVQLESFEGWRRPANYAIRVDAERRTARIHYVLVTILVTVPRSWSAPVLSWTSRLWSFPSRPVNKAASVPGDLSDHFRIDRYSMPSPSRRQRWRRTSATTTKTAVAAALNGRSSDPQHPPRDRITSRFSPAKENTGELRYLRIGKLYFGEHLSISVQ